MGALLLLAQMVLEGGGCRPVASRAEVEGRVTIWRCRDGSVQVEKNGEWLYFFPPDPATGCRYWVLRREGDERGDEEAALGKCA